MPINPNINMMYEGVQMPNVLANAQAGEALKSSRMTNALAAEKMAEEKSPEGIQKKQLQGQRTKQQSAMEDIKMTLPSLGPDNWSRFGEYMKSQYGDAGVFGGQYDPAAHEKMMQNFGITKPQGQGAAAFSGSTITGPDGQEYVLNKQTGQMQPTGITRGLKPTEQPEYRGSIAAITAQRSAAGKLEGERGGEVQELEARLPALQEVTQKLSDLGKVATYTTAGRGRDLLKRELGMQSGEGAVARQSYISTVDNEVLPLLRSTFGAAFTAAEGNSLRATLGDVNMSPEEKDAALAAFIDAKVREVRTMKRVQGVGIPAPQTSVPFVNQQGWSLHTDAAGNQAYVGPNGEIEELQ